MNFLKKLTCVMVVAIPVAVSAQAPHLFNYQGVARDNGGNILANQNIGLQIDIRQSTPTGTIVFSETNGSTTNTFGLFNIEIGGGTPVVANLSVIDWEQDPTLLK